MAEASQAITDLEDNTETTSTLQAMQSKISDNEDLFNGLDERVNSTIEYAENTRQWTEGKFADSSATIEDMLGKISDNKDAIDSLTGSAASSSDLITLTGRVNGHDAAISSLDSDMDGADANLTNQINSQLTGSGLRSLIGQWWNVQTGSLNCDNLESSKSQTFTFSTQYAATPTVFVSVSDWKMYSSGRPNM